MALLFSCDDKLIHKDFLMKRKILGYKNFRFHVKLKMNRREFYWNKFHVAATESFKFCLEFI